MDVEQLLKSIHRDSGSLLEIWVDGITLEMWDSGIDHLRGVGEMTYAVDGEDSTFLGIDPVFFSADDDHIRLIRIKYGPLLLTVGFFERESFYLQIDAADILGTAEGTALVEIMRELASVLKRQVRLYREGGRERPNVGPLAQVTPG